MENGWEARNPFQAVCIAVDLTEPVPATLRMKISLQMFVTVLSATSALGGDWAGWRGPTHDGIAAAGQKVPVRWDEQRNILWKVPVPGKGHASPTVVEDRIFLPTADVKRKVESVLCLSRKTGMLIWRKDQRRATKWPSPGKSHPFGTRDGRRLQFHGDDAVTRRRWIRAVRSFGRPRSPTTLLIRVVLLRSSTNRWCWFRGQQGGIIGGLDRKRAV